MRQVFFYLSHVIYDNGGKHYDEKVCTNPSV